MTLLPDSIADWVAFAIAVSGGLLAFYYAFNKQRKDLVKEDGDLKNDIIKDYKERLEQLEKTTGEQVTQINTLNKKVADLEAVNRTLTEVFQGIDKNSIEYRNKGIEAMVKGDKVFEMVTEIKNGNKAILEAIKLEMDEVKRLYVLIEKHLDNESKMIDAAKK